MNIQLGPPAPAAKKCVDEGWLEDSRMMGFGKGLGGQCKASDALLYALKCQTPDKQLLGVYDAVTPVGLVWVDYLGDVRRTAQIHFLIAPNKRGKWAFQKAGRMVLDYLFNNDVYRIEAEPLRINKRCIKLLRHYGFKQEGIKRSSLWMDGNPYDQVALRMLRCEWRKT